MTVLDRMALTTMIASCCGIIVAKMDNDDDQRAISMLFLVVSSCAFVIFGLFE